MSGLYTVFLKINHCHHAPIADFSTSDPFVQIYLGKQMIGKTPIIEKNLNPVWNYKMTFTRNSLNTTLEFLIVDDDKGQDNDLLGRVTFRLDSIADGNHVFSVEKQELHHSTVQKLFQNMVTFLWRSGGDFTLSFDIQITRNVVFPESFLTLISTNVYGTATASTGTVPRLGFIKHALWEQLSIAQRKLVTDYYQDLNLKTKTESEIIDLIFHLVPPADNFQEEMIIRREPNIQQSTKVIILNNSVIFDLHHRIDKNAIQLNLNEQESSFFRIKFKNRLKMLIWFEWLVNWWSRTDNKDDWPYPPSMEESVLVVSHVGPVEKEVLACLNFSSDNAKIGPQIVGKTQLRSILLSADLQLPGEIVAEVQVNGDDNLSYHGFQLRNQRKDEQISFDDEEVNFFDFNEDDSVNLITINSSYGTGQKIIGTGQLNLPEIYQELSGELGTVVRTFKLNLTGDKFLQTLHPEFVAKIQLKASHLLNNLWYGEEGNLNIDPKVVFVHFECHHLALYGYDQSDSDDLQSLYKISWGNVSHVNVVTPSILSLRYQYGSTSKQLFVFNCPSERLWILATERRQFSPYRQIVDHILACGKGDKELAASCFSLCRKIDDATKSDFFKGSKKAKLLFQLYLTQVMEGIDWEYYSVEKISELTINRIENLNLSEDFNLSTDEFTKEDFKKMNLFLIQLCIEMQVLVCFALLKGFHDHFQDPGNDIVHFQPVKFILEKFSQRIFDLIGIFYSYPFQVYVETCLSSILATEQAWKSAMMFYKDAQQRLIDLQEFFESIPFSNEYSLKFQTPVLLSKHLPYSILEDNFVNAFILETKKMIPNNIKSAIQDSALETQKTIPNNSKSAIQDRAVIAQGDFNAIKDISSPFLKVLNEKYEMMIKNEFFPQESIRNLSGLIYLDTVLSFGRKVADEILPTSDAWLLLPYKGSSDQEIEEKWERCIEYSIQIAVFAYSLQHGENLVLQDVDFPCREEYQVLMKTLFEEMIDKAVDQLSCGLFILLHRKNCLSKGLNTDPVTLFTLITDRLSHVEDYLSFAEESYGPTDYALLRWSITSALVDAVIGKFITYYFAILILSYTNESRPTPNITTLTEIGKQATSLHRNINEYLHEQNPMKKQQNDCAYLSSYFPNTRFSLRVLSFINQLLTNDTNQLNPLLQQLIKESRTNGIESSQMNSTILQFVHFCFFLRKVYSPSSDISQLESLLKDCERKLSALGDEKADNGPVARFSPIVSVFGQLVQPVSKSNTSSLLTVQQCPTFLLSFEQILADHMLLTPLPKDKRIQKFNEFNSFSSQISSSLNKPFTLVTSWFRSLFSEEDERTSLVKNDDSPREHYSLISVMQLLYSEDELETLSQRIQRLKNMNIRSFDLTSMVPSTEEKKPLYLSIPQIQLMDMFYLAAQTIFYLYVVIQIGSWVRSTKRIRGNVFNDNLLHPKQPIHIPIYHPLTQTQLSSPTRKSSDVVQNNYLSEEIIVYIMYSTNGSENESFNCSDTVIGTFTIPFYHYHYFDSVKTPGNLVLNSKDSPVNQAIVCAKTEKRNLPSINYALHYNDHL